MTITRALKELKTLQARYKKGVQELNLVAVKQGSKLRSPNTFYKEDDFVEQAKAKYQSVQSLFNRIIFIKSEIDKSNSVTKIKMGTVEMTIQEALVYKKYIDMKKSLLSQLKSLSREARSDFDGAERENAMTLEKMVTSTIGRDGTDEQKASARKEAEDYIEKTKKVSLIDPCSIDTLIESLDSEITEFESNIDYALSESNSTTHIDIPD